MLPLATQIRLEHPDSERRRAPRHAVALAVAGPSRAVIDNLSESGLALVTNAPLSVGSTFDIELPLAGTVTARVAWSEEGLFGCEFQQPIARAAVSAARLRSPFEPQASVVEAATVAVPELAPRPVLAVAVMLAFAAVAAMFVAALLTAPFASF
jgi:hypothetical protein